MVRRWFSIAGALAIAGVMLATDVSQAGPLQRLRDRLRGTNDESSTSRFGFRRSFFRNAEPAVASNQVALDIRVPTNAEVWVNDTKISQQTGTLRSFTSENLTAGQTYSYKVKAQWTGDAGKKMTRERTVEARPGQKTTVDLTRSRTSPEQIKQPKDSGESKESKEKD